VVAEEEAVAAGSGEDIDLNGARVTD